MSLFEQMIVCLTSGTRLDFLNFRHKVVTKYGYEKFKELLDKANKELKK